MVWIVILFTTVVSLNILTWCTIYVGIKVDSTCEATTKYMLANYTFEQYAECHKKGYSTLWGLKLPTSIHAED